MSSPSTAQPAFSVELPHEPWVLISDTRPQQPEQHLLQQRPVTPWLVKIRTQVRSNGYEILVSNMSLVWFEQVDEDRLTEKQDVSVTFVSPRPLRPPSELHPFWLEVEPDNGVGAGTAADDFEGKPG